MGCMCVLCFSTINESKHVNCMWHVIHLYLCTICMFVFICVCVHGLVSAHVCLSAQEVLGVYIKSIYLPISCVLSLCGLSACMYVCFGAFGWVYCPVDLSSVLHHNITLETVSSFFSRAENNKTRLFSSRLSFNGWGNLSFLPLILHHLLPTIQLRRP